MLLCRDRSAPPPPRKVCGRCGQWVQQWVIRADSQPGPAYEPATTDMVLAMMAPSGDAPPRPAWEPATPDMIRRIAYGLPV